MLCAFFVDLCISGIMVASSKMAKCAGGKKTIKPEIARPGKIQSQLRNVLSRRNAQAFSEPSHSQSSASGSGSQHELVATEEVDLTDEDGQGQADFLDGPVASDVSSVICIRCAEWTSWGESSAYGRDPFKRSCNACNSAYKCKQDLVKKEKATNGNSAMDAFFRGLSKDQVRDWYKNQKRKHEKGNRRSEMKPMADINSEAAHEHELRSGRKRINVITTFSKFQERGLMLNKSEADIAEEWKNLVLDTRLKREMVDVGLTEPVLGLHLFDRIELFAEESEARQWRIRCQTDLQTSEELPEAIEEQAAEFHQARAAGELDICVAPEHQALDWDNRIADKDIEPHLCPVPQSGFDYIVPPSMGMPATADLLKLMQSHEKSTQEAEDALRSEALEAQVEKAKRLALEEAKKPLTNAKALIAAKGVAAGQLLGMTQRNENLQSEGEVTKGLILDSTLPKKEDMVIDIDANLEKAAKFTDTVTSAFKEKVKDFDVADMTVEAMREVKNFLKQKFGEFCAEGSIFKVAKFAIETHGKTVTQHLRKNHRLDQKSKHVTAQILGGNSDSVWANNPLAQNVHKACFARAPLVCELAAIPESEELDKPIAVRMPDMQVWVEKIKNGQYFKTQKTYLTQWLSKNPGQTNQETAISVRLLQGELDKLGSAMQAAVKLEVPKEAAKAKSSWGKAFQWGFSLSTGHCQVGVGSFCLGELICGIEGRLNYRGLGSNMFPQAVLGA